MLTLGSPHLPPVVFVHGFMGRGAHWLSLAQALSDRFFCLLPDLPGHGEALPFTSPITFEGVLAHLFQQLTVHQVKRAIWVGYSLGGRVTLEVACRYPEWVRALVLESAHPGLNDPAARQHRLAEDAARAETIRREGMAEFVSNWYAMPLFASLRAHPHILAEIQATAARNHPEAMAQAIVGLSPGVQTPWWEALPTLTLPTLWLAGELDARYVSTLTQAAALMPHAQAQVIPQAGHNIHAEQPSAWLAIVRPFLDSVAG